MPARPVWGHNNFLWSQRIRTKFGGCFYIQNYSRTSGNHVWGEKRVEKTQSRYAKQEASSWRSKTSPISINRMIPGRVMPPGSQSRILGFSWSHVSYYPSISRNVCCRSFFYRWDPGARDRFARNVQSNCWPNDNHLTIRSSMRDCVYFYQTYLLTRKVLPVYLADFAHPVICYNPLKNMRHVFFIMCKAACLRGENHPRSSPRQLFFFSIF